MTDFVTELKYDSPLGVAEFALDRALTPWVPANWDLPVLDLGPGNKLIPGAIRMDWPEWDGEKEGSLQDFSGESVGGIFAINILEHLRDPRPLIREMGQVLAPGCAATIFVPNARSGMYLQDLDHKTPFIIDTFKNFIEPHPYYAKDHDPTRLKVGAVFNFGVKEDNLGIVAQLVKLKAAM